MCEILCVISSVIERNRSCEHPAIIGCEFWKTDGATICFDHSWALSAMIADQSNMESVYRIDKGSL